jgi:hypothetical protein
MRLHGVRVNARCVRVYVSECVKVWSRTKLCLVPCTCTATCVRARVKPDSHGSMRHCDVSDAPTQDRQ